MSGFSLRSQRSGQYKEFSILEILRLLGDPINDEIWLQNGEDVFNLSSYRDNEGNGSSGGQNTNWNIEIPSQVAGERIFYLQYIPSAVLLIVILNGIVLSRYKDYNLEGRSISFNYPLNGQDNVQFIYQY